MAKSLMDELKPAFTQRSLVDELKPEFTRPQPKTPPKPKSPLTKQQELEISMPFYGSGTAQNVLTDKYKELDALKLQNTAKTFNTYATEIDTTDYKPLIAAKEEAINRIRNQFNLPERASGAGGFGHAVMKGLNQALLDLSTFALTSPLNPVRPVEIASAISGQSKSDITKMLLSPLQKEQDYATQKVKEAQSTRGDVYKFLTGATSTVSQALPQTLLAIATSGGSAAATLPALGSNAGLATAVNASLAKMVQNPVYWTSFAQSAGSSYNDAIASGATEDQAALSSTLSGLIVAGIEMTGGIEGLPAALKGGNRSAINQWVSTALDEGKEEVVQGIVDRLFAKVVYDPNKPLVSLTDPNAVFNPSTAAREFGGGAAIGGLFGGVFTGANTVAQNVQQNIQQRQQGPVIQTPTQQAQPVIPQATAPITAPAVQPDARTTLDTQYQTAVQAQQNTIQQLQQAEEKARSDYINIRNEFQGTDIATRRPELLAEANVLQQRLQQATQATQEARTQLDQLTTDYNTQISGIETDAAAQQGINEIVSIASDFQNRFITPDAIAEMEQIGELQPQVTALRKAFDRASRLQNRINRLNVQLTASDSLNESVRIQGEIDALTGQLESAASALTNAQNSIINYAAQAAAPGAAQAFPGAAAIPGATTAPGQSLAAAVPGQPTITQPAGQAAQPPTTPPTGQPGQPIPPAENTVIMQREAPQTTVRERVGDAASYLYTRLFDSQNPIVKFSKVVGDRIRILASNARNAGGITNNILVNNLVDRDGNTIGPAFAEVAGKIPQEQEKAFWEYMMERHNIDRAREGKNLIPNHDSAQSQQMTAELEAQNPEWKQIGDELTGWIDTFMQEWGVNSGLISTDLYTQLRQTYPSYWPTQRDFDDIEIGLPTEVKSQFLDVKAPVRRAGFSGRDVQNPVQNIIELINRTVKAARYNAVGQEFATAIRNDPANISQYAEIVSPEEATSSSADNYFTVLENGQKTYLKLNDKPLMDALKGLPKSTLSVKILSKPIDVFKGVVTTNNPFFGIFNALRDVQTAYVYGSEANPVKYFGGLFRAYGDIATKAEPYQLYRGVGGGMSNFNVSQAPELARTLGRPENILTRAVRSFNEFNSITETAPRLAEFKRVLDSTGDVQAALDAANSVTINFARGGDVTKLIDRNLAPYLNAGLQGVDKLVRSFKTPRAAASTLIKGGIAVLAPSIALALLNKDDEDYENLSNQVKDNYYIIPIGSGHKDGVVGNSKFLKIPRSRELGVLMGALAERIMRAASGEKEAFKGYGTSLAAGFVPSNPLTSNIFSPILNLRANQTFTGAPIVPRSMTDDERSQYLQYDETTSQFSTAIAKLLYEKTGIDWSPKKMDYLIDAYTGFIGDIVLPATTKGRGAFTILGNKFIADPLYSNQTVVDFYDNLDKVEQKATDKNITQNLPSTDMTIEEKLANAMSKTSSQMSELTKLSLKAAIGTLSADDKAKVSGYGLDPELTGEELQTALRQKRRELSQAANDLFRNDSTNETAIDLFRKRDIGSFKYEDRQYALTPDEYTAFAQTVNTMPEQLMQTVQNLGGYDKLTKEQKDAVVTAVTNFAEDTAKQNVVTKRGFNFKLSTPDVVAAIQANIPIQDYFKAYNEYQTINDNKNISSSVKANQFAGWVDQELPTLTGQQRSVLKDKLQYAAYIPQQAEKYSGLVSAGLESDAATKAYDSLLDVDAKAQGADREYLRRITAMNIPDDDKLKIISVYFKPSDTNTTYQKYATANLYDVSVSDYTNYIQNADADGNNRVSEKEAIAALRAMNLTDKQKGLLFAMTNKTFTKAGGNPFYSGFVYDKITWAN